MQISVHEILTSRTPPQPHPLHLPGPPGLHTNLFRRTCSKQHCPSLEPGKDILQIKINRELIHFALIFPIYLIFKFEDRTFVDTICGIRRNF